MTQEITMGSLFSGSGGFELAGSIFGIIPIKQQEAGWNRMVRNLEHRKAKENHRKEVKTNGRNA